tara:strand:- start:309 stop:560 length:252 start_codon:yes stop_codon:yes gene_type:complete
MEKNNLPFDEVQTNVYKFAASVNLVHVIQVTIDELIVAEELYRMSFEQGDKVKMKEYKLRSDKIMKTLANLSTAAENTLGIYA